MLRNNSKQAAAREPAPESTPEAAPQTTAPTAPWEAAALSPRPGGVADGGAARRLTGLRAAVLLAGSVRANPFWRATGRAMLQMPLAADRSVLGAWRGQLAGLVKQMGLGTLRARVMLDRAATELTDAHGGGGVELSVERDPSEFRGTGGLLSDLVRDYGDDQFILVAPAAQVLMRPLHEVAGALADAGADAAIACDTGGRPAGVMLIRCGCLRSISEVGFVDLNEQALPTIARVHDVRVVRFAGPTSLPLRTRRGYIAGLAAYHQRREPGPTGNMNEDDAAGDVAGGAGGEAALGNGLEAERWEPRFAVVEPGAWVHESVVVHDSVVLAGASVRRGAVLVRSVVGPGAVVPEGRTVIDAVVGPLTGGGEGR